MRVVLEQDELIKRWQRAAERAQDEGVRVVLVGEAYRATSSSQPLGSYLLSPTSRGWSCECVANAEYGLPCKHLSALADALGLDVVQEMDVEWAADRAA